MGQIDKRSVLLLEDDPFISLDAYEAIIDNGHDCVVAHDCETAIMVLDGKYCECAVLDFDLGNETSIPIALRLEEIGMPYCFVTGRSVEEIIQQIGLNSQVFTKPANYAQIADTLLSR